MNELRHKSFGSVGTATQPKQEVEQMSQSDLRSLIELGCIKDSITINNMVFVMRTISAIERIQLKKMLGDNPDDDIIFDFNLKLLSMAIESIDGKSLESFHPDMTLDPMDRREQVLAQMQMPVLSQLMGLYNKITDRCDNQFTSDQIKNLQRS